MMEKEEMESVFSVRTRWDSIESPHVKVVHLVIRHTPSGDFTSFSSIVDALTLDELRALGNYLTLQIAKREWEAEQGLCNR
jgi:L-cystine uptake protein TcyP (sodium:dicarboxylate symporter family)